jgi:eukaryotic-like serine/threonine-protein kinase
MDPERWKSIESLYHAALALEPSQRAKFLGAACPKDPGLQREVESLIGYAARADQMLEVRPPLPNATRITTETTLSNPSTLAAFQSGAVLSKRFRIVRLIGAGGMGEVYEAEDVVLGESVALKTIRPDIVDQERLRARLLQEVHAAKRIAHPGICRIHDLHLHQPPEGQGGEVTFLTMELLSGETLGARLRRGGPMDLDEASTVTEQLASALSAAHRARVIHRDFKSENIILEPTPDNGVRAVVTDFGLARSESRPAGSRALTRTGQIVGTLTSMAPEQLVGGPVTAAADIYAFGIVLYEMVTGTQPFTGGSRLATAAKRLRSDPPSPRIIVPDLPLEWERAILRCLDREPANRFADAAGVWQAILLPR